MEVKVFLLYQGFPTYWSREPVIKLKSLQSNVVDLKKF